jgi:Protein of unknown function (DUF2815)
MGVGGFMKVPIQRQMTKEEMEKAAEQERQLYAAVKQQAILAQNQQNAHWNSAPANPYGVGQMNVVQTPQIGAGMNVMMQILDGLHKKIQVLEDSSKAQETVINTLMARNNDLAKHVFEHEAAIRELGDIDMADKKQSNPVVQTPVGLLSFPNLETARAAVEGGEPRFSANLIFDEEAQKTDAYKALSKAVMDAAVQFFGDKLPKDIRWPIRDAAEKEGTYAGYEDGKKFVGAWTKNKPGLIGPDKADVLPTDVFAGQKARFAVRPFAYNKTGNKGVGLALEAVQITKFDMPRLDGKTDAKKFFDEVENKDDDGDDLPF